MAYQKAQLNTEHPSKTIVKMVKSAQETGLFPKVMLLCGKEDFLVSWAKNYLKQNILNPATAMLDLSVFNEANYDAYEIIAACETMPMMSTRKLVIVEDTDIFSLTPKDMPKEQVEALAEYLASIPESTMLVFTCSKPNKTKAIYKALVKSGIVYDFVSLDDATLAAWMQKRLTAAGKTASSSDLLSFAKACGYGDDQRSYNLNNLENDIKKVIALSDSDKLVLEDFLEASRGEAEQNAFKLLDSAFSNNKELAYSILHSSINSQIPSKEIGIVLQFLGLICSQLEIMLESKERSEEGQAFPQIANEMGVHEFRLKKAMLACQGKTSSDLRASLYRAFQIEKDLKNGIMDPYIAMELFIANL